MKIYSDITLKDISSSISSNQNTYVLVQGGGDSIVRKAPLTVNGTAMDDNGNIATSLSATITGLSSSLSSSFPFISPIYSPRPPVSGTLFIVSGETGPASSSNGQTFVFVTSSAQAGQWVQVQGFDQVAADNRYARIDVSETQNLTSSYAVTASYITSSNVYGPYGFDSVLTASYAATSSITYVSSSNFSLSELEVFDYSNDVAVVYTNNRLKLIFGTPQSQSISSFTFGGTFATDRFNKVLDNYTATATWANNAYTLISAKILTGSTILANTSTGTSLPYSTTTSGSQTYKLEITASSPLDNSIIVISQSLDGTLSKSNPDSPTQVFTALIQLGTGSNQIEQGATGSISLTSTTGSLNDWSITGFTGTGSFSTTRVPLFGNNDGTQGTATFFVTASATSSNNIIISSTASYSSLALNDPTITTSVYASQTYSKIRSLRGGASSLTTFTVAQLEDLALWDTTIGGTIGTIYKGTTTATGQSVTITWTGDKYHYIVYNSSLSNLTNIQAGVGGTSVFTQFGSAPFATVGSYKIYRTTTVQSGYAGTTITYYLT